MPRRIPPPVAALAAALSLGAAACGGSSSDVSATPTAASTGPTPADGLTEEPRVEQAAPDLERLLPTEVRGTRLRVRSATGADVFGGDAFSREMTRFLATAGKEPRDLRFANATDPSDSLGGLEVGVFHVAGVDAVALRSGIVASARPNAPGLEATPRALGGKRVTEVVYPGGSTLYLYERDDRVFYVGTLDEGLAAEALRLLP
jgi:hypothetical protein